MDDNPKNAHTKREQELSKEVGQKETRKLKARGEYNSIWFGLGTFGLIGWAVTIPTLIGIFLGVWLDANTTSQFSWTLMLMLAGVGLGCLNAWHWVDRESRSEKSEKKGKHDDDKRTP